MAVGRQDVAESDTSGEVGMFEIRETESYIMVSATGACDLKEILTTIEQEFAMASFPRLNDIWVFDDKPIAIQFVDLEVITRFVAAICPQGTTRTKSALVAPEGLNGALLQMWASTAEVLPYEVKVFSNITDAEDWLAA